MNNYIAYYRVSTKTQSDSGLGLEAQRQAVSRYIGEGNMHSITEVTEIESGKKTDRPMLNEAISLCLDTGATLVIARLDRLSRNASFTFSLMDSGVKFVAVDMPQANELTIGIMAVIAQDEAKRIASRTHSALLVIKEKIKRGEEHISKSGRVILKLGTPSNLTSEAREKSIASRKKSAVENENNKRAYAFIKACNGSTLCLIASRLNEGGFKTRSGKEFSPITISRLIKLYANR